eukprot:Gregarina_sp_Pseudo_9__395@NODE_1259_length_1736_cov_8_998232_g1184_i0_p1_GENE_NODE_1259_length_1736_cov_8_998232_g1184_i0NODE_1259_length_1736_cov_8_998232_g1184_i0_p1_ORF_typecomplete_len363_score39_71zfLITAFlike/PF10601_9/5e12zfLITAFlike/PF10601_9/4_3e02Cytochrom_B_C/PF00032_17/0_28zfCSL/PF05207_13/6_8e02zfCSL/PF05207_13/0_15zf_Rg/PF17915_1/3_8e03zf_Rg/PF17915_1/0_26DUF4131/PF13567_6/26zinc_ribbon_15/PF17032_5/3_5e02zinc_ribbon_15/PF17032_5/2_9e02zinc_ribbon_15/PF17032_5/2_4Sgf11/PF08209_11/2
MSFGIERQETEGIVPPKSKVEQKEPSSKHFNDTPVHCVCPWCSRSVVTQVEYQSTWVSIVVFVLLFLFLHIFSFCVYPFISSFTQQFVHVCPRCSGEIHRARQFELPSIRHEVITLRCGSCALVISRKYLFGALCCLLLVCGASTLRWYVRTFGLPDIEEGPVIDATWADYVRDCGTRSSLGNPLHAQARFEHDYYGKTVRWEGRLLEVKEGYFRKNFLFLVMDPHQHSSAAFADLAMIYNGIKLDSAVSELEVGDKLEFTATLLELGRRGRPHVGAVFSLARTAKAESLPDLFENETMNYLQRPPIAYLPKVVKGVGEMRRNMISQMEEQNPFMLGGELVGVPVHVKPQAKRANEAEKGGE